MHAKVAMQRKFPSEPVLKEYSFFYFLSQYNEPDLKKTESTSEFVTFSSFSLTLRSSSQRIGTSDPVPSSDPTCNVPHQIGENVPSAIYVEAPLNPVDAF